MSRISHALRCVIATLALSAVAAYAADTNEAPFTTKLSHVVYDVEKDGRYVVDVTTRIQVLQQSALEHVKRFSFSFSNSTQTGEVLEAYTLKKDGRKIPVPAGNYQHQTNEGRADAGPFFSDRKAISAVFPDLEVGDSVHIQYRETDKEAMFPGQFSVAMRYSPFASQEDVRVTVRAPKDMVLRQEHHFMDFSEVERDGKRVMEWRYSGTKPRKRSDDDEGLWSYKEVPGFLVSTFLTYEAIAQAYGARALPKAAPTPAIKDLANKIVGAETQPRERTRKLYEWVSRNITYGGNCIGVGAVVPRDLNVVIESKIGDCKDHATLLQALLTAVDIPSEQVLVGVGGDYELPEVPVVSMVNHVFNYLPTLKMYVDATAKEIPFGYLPSGTYDKPVIHVGAAKALAKVPGPVQSMRGQQRLEMSLKITDSGAATGAMNVKVKGVEAAQVRSYLRELNGQQEREFVKTMLNYYGYRGRGTLEHSNVQGLGDDVEFTIKFEIDNYLRNAGATGSLYVGPVMNTPLAVSTFGADEGPAPRRTQICHGFTSAETYKIELPTNLSVISLPEDASLKGTYVDYKATYKQVGQRLTINRTVDDKTPGSICAADMYAEFMKQAAPVGENLRTQVLYKRKR
ncbi:DUF3857 domain-containing transglutaminase family protein [Methylibium rhizosphaerae]|uniref:DUF3857 domain-containing transglutaminase family protein n=1 Tax=Methylibium rhizosphaerae TaxID=2570323 RepID=UPI00112D930B|nr:DUF3857 and transglutaminase domain-containing protein [Methylibium rhizosphaerae]